ncbi:MAG: DUF1801 domain-containing protein [Saprospiraceae bacterium]|nr:DUF1801 domain-containing protein [Saprospiraceae bacterium]
MNILKIKENEQVQAHIDSYPSLPRKKLNAIRKLIFEAASEIEGLKALNETFKWGEPSYSCKKGSTIRMDWKSKNPDQYAMYFICSTRLVETFRTLYGDTFEYEKNRALIFHLKDDIPVYQLKECIKMALRYHELKDQPLLGN